MKLFEDSQYYSKLHDDIFNHLLPHCARNKLTTEAVLKEVAKSLGVTEKDYIHEFVKHPEWPSPKTIINYYENL